MKKIIGITAAVLAAFTLAGCSSNQDVPAPTTSTSTTATITSAATVPSTIAPPTPTPVTVTLPPVTVTEPVPPAVTVTPEVQTSTEIPSEAQTGDASGGWYGPGGSYISPETEARALAAGIATGETIPNYLRCGTICGESPTSGDAQMSAGCDAQWSSLTGEQCADEGYTWGGDPGYLNGERDGTGMYAIPPDGPCTLGDHYGVSTCRQGPSGPYWQGQ